MFSLKKQAKLTRFWASRARFKLSAGHILPAGGMLRMLGVKNNQMLSSLQLPNNGARSIEAGLPCD
jgi:hypothetical protein